MSEKALTETVHHLNDLLRSTFIGGEVVITAGIQGLSATLRASIMRQVQEFDTWTPANDPNSEHDSGSFDANDHKVFWRVAYYNQDMSARSEDPADPNVTTRVLTVMLAEEI
jgi:hypothetical protein